MEESQETLSSAEQTRARLIEAGLKVFAHYGFAGASTRMLASAAKVNLAAIPYHFGGKEGLYHAVIRHIAGIIGQRLQEPGERIKALLEQAGAEREALVAALEGLLLTLARFLVGSKQADLFGPIIIREQMEPTAAFQILYEEVIDHHADYLCQLVGRLLHKESDDPEVVFRTHALLGQVIVFRAARATLLYRMKWEDISADQVDPICQAISMNIRAIVSESQVS